MTRVGLPMYPNMGLQAQEIMHLAATPIDFSQNGSFGGSFGGITAYRAIPCHLQVTSNRHVSLPLRPAAMISQFMQTGKSLRWKY